MKGEKQVTRAEIRFTSILGLAVLCVFMLGLASISAFATNLVQNPSFENFTAGKTYGDGVIQWIDTWRYFSVNGAGGSLKVITPGQDGNVAVELSRTSMTGDSGINTSDIAVQEYHTYRVDFWAKSATNTQLLAKVSSFKGPSSGSGNFLGDNVSRTLPLTSQWKKFSLTYSAMPTCVAASVSFRAAAATGNVDVDNVTFEETTNLMPDPSFECMDLGATFGAGDTQVGAYHAFSLNGAGGTVTVVSPGHSGSKAIQLSRTSMSGDAGLGMAYKMYVLPGHSYRAMVWVRSDNETPLYFRVSSFNSTGGFLGDTVNLTYMPSSPKWELCAIRYTVPAGCANVSVAFRAAATGGNVLIDDASLVDETNLTGNLFPDPSFDSFYLDSLYASNTTIGPFKFFTVGAASGLLGIVPGHDANGTAIQLLRTSGGSDTGLQLSDARKVVIPVSYGHVYSLKFWAESTTGQTQMRATMAGFQSDASTWVKDVSYFFTPGTNWTQFSDVYTPPSSSIAYVYPGFRAWGDNSDVTIDDVEIVDITSSYKGTLTGTVSNALTGVGIAGAVVTITSSGTNMTATADAKGAYTLNNVPSGTYTLTASATGYKTTKFQNVGVSVNSTQNVGIMPANMTWSVYDTFTRDNTQPGNFPLGTTEGTFAIPWVKTKPQVASWFGNTNSFINGNTLVTSYGSSTYGTDPCGAGLDQVFTPSDFDLTVNMNWLEPSTSLWSIIAYRQSQAAAMTQGYAVKFPYDGQHVYLQYNGNNVVSATLTTSYPNWSNVTVRIVVCGNSHKIYVNGTLVIDTVDNNNTGGGYISLFSDATNSVAWDNLTINSIPDGMITGTVYDKATGAPISGAQVTINQTGDIVKTGADGIYSISLTPGSYTLTASPSGYEALTSPATVTSNNTTTVDFALTASAQSVDTLMDAKKLPDGTAVSIVETLVATAASGAYTDGSYYVENANRVYGIKVLNGRTVTPGSRITGLTGAIQTDSNGERYINSTAMTVTTGNPLGALGMNNRTAAGSLTQSLLVKIWGNVTAIANDNSYFYVDDGSNVNDGTGNVGIRIDCSKSTATGIVASRYIGESVSVTGEMGLAKSGSTAFAVIRPTSSLDVADTVVNPAP